MQTWNSDDRLPPVTRSSKVYKRIYQQCEPTTWRVNINLTLRCRSQCRLLLMLLARLRWLAPVGRLLWLEKFRLFPYNNQAATICTAQRRIRRL